MQKPDVIPARASRRLPGAIARLLFGLATTGLVLLATGCDFAQAKSQAEAAVVIFHRELDAGDFDAIWNRADERFREGASRDTYDKFMGAVHRKLGPIVKTTMANWNVSSKNFHTTVVLTYETQFDHGTGTETFTFAVDRKTATLLDYNVRSMDLIIT